MFGGGATNNVFGGGGGFGSTPAPNTASTGFGANASSGSLFGQQPQGSGGFGSTAPTNTGFGSNTNTGFGSNTTTGFGAAANTGFGASSTQQNQGTGGTPFQAHVERDGASNSNSHYQSITFQQPYTNFSFEELRAADYNQGRRFGNQNGQAGAFGASTGFGGIGSTSSTGFGGAANTSGGLFGNNQAATNTTGFGSTTATPAFGASNTTGGGLFGQNKPATGGLFGSNTTAPTGGFGATPTTGAFGANTGGFGATNNSGGLFGQNQNKSLFGNTGTTTGGFGSTTNTGGFGQANTTGTSLFGNTANNQASTTGGFGQPAGQTGGFGGFGSSQPNQTANQTGGGLFGGSFGANNNNANQPKSLFGAPAATTGSNLFGGQNQAQNNQQSGGLFGNNTNNQQQGGGLFGAKPAGNSLFGNTTNNATTGSSLFGGLNNQNQQQNTGNSLFGQTNNQPKSLFGATTNNNTGGSLFGGMGQNNNNNTQGNSLFGNTQNQNQQSPFGGSLFGNSQQNQQQNQQPQQLTTSIMSNNPYGNDHLFVSLAASPQAVGPLATPLSSSQKPRKPAPLPQYKINPAASSRLITPQKRSGYGFAYSTYGSPTSGSSSITGTATYGGNLLGGSVGRPSISAVGKSLSTSNLRGSYNPEDSILNPGAFSASGLRTFGGTGSLKRLHIDRSLRVDLFGGEATADSSKPSPLKKTVSFGGHQGGQQQSEIQQNGEMNNAFFQSGGRESATPSAQEQGYLRSSQQSESPRDASSSTPENNSSKGKEVAVIPDEQPTSPTQNGADKEDRAQPQSDKKPGEYYMIPSLSELHKMSREKLGHVSPFVVGRENIGKIEFDKVDLTQVDVDKIIPEIIKLEMRSATVYVNHANKPPVGKGLNVPAKVTLDNSWPRSSRGGEALLDRKGPKIDKHISRLRKVQDTEFVEYKPENGQWIFRVEHFSTYAYPEDDEDMTALPESPTPAMSSRYSGIHGRSSFLSNGSTAQNSVDDTFEFRRSRPLPGSFDGPTEQERMDTSMPEMTQVTSEDDRQHDDDMTSEHEPDGPGSELIEMAGPSSGYYLLSGSSY